MPAIRLARVLLTGLVLLACLWSSPALAYEDSVLYKECAMTYRFPGGQYFNTFAPPHELNERQKKGLIECASKSGSPGFVKWVNKVLKDDIKRGLIDSATDMKPVADSAPAPGPGQSSSGGGTLLVAVLVFLVGAGLILGMAKRQFVTGEGMGWGPLMLGVVAFGFIVFALYGAANAGKGIFDEMGGLYPVFAAGAALIVGVIAAIWILIANRRDDGD